MNHHLFCEFSKKTTFDMALEACGAIYITSLIRIKVTIIGFTGHGVHSSVLPASPTVWDRMSSFSDDGRGGCPIINAVSPDPRETAIKPT